MTSHPFRVELLTNDHSRTEFECGEPALTKYLRTQATQDMRRHMANCFVAVEEGGGPVAGYYTLSAAGIPLSDLPDDITKRLPRYPVLPAVRIGRLAVDNRFRGRGLGAALLADAAMRSLSAGPAAFALLVEAKNERAVAFYRHHEFRSLISMPHSLFFPLATIRAVAQREGNS